jgi:hypothetical protein
VASVTDVEVAPNLAPLDSESPLRVVEGSALLFEALPTTCGNRGYVAVLQVTGDLAAVTRGYLGQFAEAHGRGSDLGQELVGDGDELYADSQIVGGIGLSATGLGGDPSHLLLQRCNE